MPHHPDDLIHDRLHDVSRVREPKGLEREVVDLLELDPHHRARVRLSDAQWRLVDRVVARITAAEDRATVPHPRTPTVHMEITTWAGEHLEPREPR